MQAESVFYNSFPSTLSKIAHLENIGILISKTITHQTRNGKPDALHPAATMQPHSRLECVLYPYSTQTANRNWRREGDRE